MRCRKMTFQIRYAIKGKKTYKIIKFEISSLKTKCIIEHYHKYRHFVYLTDSVAILPVRGGRKFFSPSPNLPINYCLFLYAGNPQNRWL